MTYFLFSFLFSLGMGSLSAQWLQVGNDIDGEVAGSRFGQSVSMSADGKRLAIGALSFSVRVYSEVGGTWSQLGSDINGVGKSVSLSADGKRLAIGAGNFVRVYSESEGAWSQLGSDIGVWNFTVSLSADGKRLAIGAPYGGNFSGYVRVYSESGGIWSQLGSDINGEAENDYSGHSVSLSADGNRLAIGAPNGGNFSGYVRVYSESGGVWSQLGSNINGEAAFDHSGNSVSLSNDGKRLAIGATGNDNGNGNGAGHVRVYLESGGIWSQLGSDIDGEGSYVQSGYSVSLSADGNRLAVGTPYYDNIEGFYGQVRVYSENGSIWSQMGNDIDGEGLFDESGTSVSLSADGQRLAIGAPENGTDWFVPIIGAGHVRVYEAPCPDADMDGFTASDCGGTDCDDDDASINPGATEACNGIDDNCDGNIPADEADSDGDGSRICQNDCNDEDASIHPEAEELCGNAIDDDCDGLADEGCGAALTVDAGSCQVVYYGYAPQACTTLTAVISGGISPYSYSWSNGGTNASISVCPNATIVYSVTVTDHVGATAVNGVTVEVVDVHCGNNNDKVLVCHIPPGNQGNPNTLCVGQSAVPDHLDHGDYLGSCGTSSPCSGGQNLIMPGSNGFPVAIERNEKAELTLIDYSGKANGHMDEVLFMVIPNPANDHIEVHTSLVSGTIKLMDINGKVILHQDAIGYKNSINTILLSDGIYYLRLENGMYCCTKSFVVIH